jgi:hypothetical protein
MPVSHVVLADGMTIAALNGNQRSGKAARMTELLLFFAIVLLVAIATLDLMFLV